MAKDSKKTPPSALEEKTKIVGDTDTLKKELDAAKKQAACLIVIRGARQGHRYFLHGNEIVFGRDPNSDIYIADASISRSHAKVIQRSDQFTLCDLNSSNGTFVNGKRIAPGIEVTLSKEDMIKMGSCVFKYLPAGEIEILYYGALGDAAHLDPLTKIYNKGYLTEVLDAEFKRSKTLKTPFSMAFFDLDHFKKVNDTYGHDCGDYVLKEFTRLIRTRFVRTKDVFARFGGEEFVLLFANTESKEAAQITEKIRAAIEAHPFIYEGKRLKITASFGVVELTLEIETATALLRKADQALYKSKSSGRNRITIA